MSNIAEGFMSQTNREFITFLSYSLRSTAEVQSQLYAALDLHYLNRDTFTLLMVHQSCQAAARVHPLPENNHQTINPKTINQITVTVSPAYPSACSR